MKKFVFALAILSAASVAQASTVKVDSVDAVDSSAGFDVHVTLGKYKFEVNPSLGRARIDIGYDTDYQPSSDEGGSYGPGEDDVLVPGLTFDKAASQVVFKGDDGKTTACADVQVTRNGNKVRVKATGLCTLTSSIDDETSDDGWQITHHKVLNVFLNTQN